LVELLAIAASSQLIFSFSCNISSFISDSNIE